MTLVRLKAPDSKSAAEAKTSEKALFAWGFSVQYAASSREPGFQARPYG
jgi:hypothetical protein